MGGLILLPPLLAKLQKGVVQPHMRENRYRDVDEALEVLRRNKVAAEDKKIRLRPGMGIRLWGAVDYLVANGWRTLMEMCRDE